MAQNRSCSQHRIDDFSRGITRGLPDSKATESAAKNHFFFFWSYTTLLMNQFSYSMIHT